MTELIVPVPRQLEEFFRADVGARPVRFRFPRGWHEVQNLIMHSKARYLAAACGTKVGKTFSCAARVGIRSFSCDARYQGIHRVIAPNFAKTGPTFDYLNRMLPERLPPRALINCTPKEAHEAQLAWEGFRPDRSLHEMRMSWRHNFARIQCMHGQDPERTIEGDGTWDNILDEAAKMKKTVFPSVLSTTSQTGGKIAEVGTPMGKNHFYARWRDAHDIMKFEMAKGIPLMECSHLALTLPTTASPFVKPEIIEDARRKLPARIFEQLYLAMFHDDGDVFSNMEAVFKGASEFSKADEFVLDVLDTDEIYLGIDVAKKQDYMVYMAFDSSGKHIGWKRYNRRQYGEAAVDALAWAEALRLKTRNKKGTVHVVYDETGPGVAFHEAIRALKRNQNIWLRGVTWNHGNKDSAINDLVMLCEGALWSLLPWEQARHEFAVFEITTNDMGKATYGAPEGDHDDVVMACALIADLIKRDRGDFEMATSDSLEDRLAFYEATGQIDEIEDML